MAPTSTWSEWISDLARVPGDTYSALIGNDYRFPSSQGLIVVHEEGPVGHLGATVRARCTTSGREYDLRRLRAGADAGGLVTLEALEALERQATLAMKAGVHSHTLRCYATLIENVGGTHCRLLLCGPCDTDLHAHLAASGGKLRPGEIADVGHQLAFGLGHLHSLGILFGGLTPTGIVRGHDGLWKLGDFRRSAELPVTVLEWRSQRKGAGQPLDGGEDAPPEAQGSGDVELWPEADVWLLGHFLAVLLRQALGGAVAPGPGKRGTTLSATPDALQEPFAARLWLLLHWLLAAGPADRPNANETAALLSTVGQALAPEMLEEMPPEAREHCRSVALAAARQLAMDEAVGAAADALERERLLRSLAGRPLEELREELKDVSRLDLLCENCGVPLQSRRGERAR
mmetsp:Transcript_9310/g.26167  ORF Transcript_9310/g.26167 Transcript_9310/m.26167 type:complete len:403 (+) Transcript_9310:77-1285(+)